jgi:hydrogenase maturation protein HypF
MPEQLMHTEIAIQGAVQGVGFRPFVYRTARAFGIRGFVRNDGHGVFIAAVAAKDDLEAFIHVLRTSHPPLAVIRGFSASEPSPLTDSQRKALGAGFSIVQSEHGERVDADVTRDTAVCDNCLREMRDPRDRRFRHPFINCTDCGPRYTIIRDLPYDRPATTMSGFPMCDDCRKEYESPESRRFHAQPICCPACGPTLRLIDANGAAINGGTPDPITRCIDLLVAGKIVAIKGIGGYHLACRADDETAVRRLRLRKMREEKPLAIMVRDVKAARDYALIGGEEQSILEGVERPIVLCAKKGDAAAAASLAPGVAPGVATLGIMLPYAPVHYLLFDDGRLAALVMTSGNTTDEPIAFDDADALGRLAPIADAFLTHNRAIHIRNDDSILRASAGAALMLRRSRGFVPDPMEALHDVNGMIGLGGVLKSTIAVGRKRMCYLSQYVGEVSNLETLEGLRRIIGHLLHVLDVCPRLFVVDRHPASLTLKLAAESELQVISAQHHHAHAAACMAENGLSENTLCVVYDGTGYGTDGCVWGGELLLADHARFTRLGHLAYLPLPGAEAAIVHPGRMAIAALFGAMGQKAAEACPWMPREEKNAVIEMVKADVNCPRTSSMGRLFDAASAILGIGTRRTYEGQPAIQLEGAADNREPGGYEPVVIESDGSLLIDGANILLNVFEDAGRGTPVGIVAARFHTTVARATAEAVKKAAAKTGCDRVCLSGGCFQNTLLAEKTTRLLSEAGLTPFTHHRVPPNDEAVSYGQLVIAAARTEEGERS